MMTNPQHHHRLKTPQCSTFRQPSWLIFPCALLVLALISGCASTGEGQEDDFKNWPAEKLFKQARVEMQNGDYQLAIEYYETLEARYPFGKLAEQAQLETCYAYYKFQEYDSAIAAADRFIKLHPSHPNVDYAYYLRGIASFHKKDSPMQNIVKQDPSKRDPSSTRDSFRYFAELVKKFPNSKYTADAIQRMRHQRNTLAKHELNVAHFYLQRGAYVAAANRAKYVIQNYPRTPSVPEALSIMAKAYTELNMQELADDAKRVLQLNYPDFEKQISHNADSKDAS